MSRIENERKDSGVNLNTLMKNWNASFGFIINNIGANLYLYMNVPSHNHHEQRIEHECSDGESSVKDENEVEDDHGD